MRKHKKHVHSERKRALKKTSWTILAIIVLFAAGSWAWRTTLVQSRVQASFGNNASYQKREYNEQRALAKKKYGESTSVVGKKSGQQKPATESRKGSSNKKTPGADKYVYITVKEGQYLSTVADEYNTTVDKLIELNNLDSRDISAGVHLKVPAHSNTSTDNSANDTGQ